MPTINILLDCTCSASFSTSDLGGGETYSGPISFKADSIPVKESRGSADHKTGQDLVSMHRKTGVDWEISVKTKFYNAALQAAIEANDLMQITITSTTTGMSVVGKGLIVNNDPTFEAPSTHDFSIKAHGTPLLWS